MAGGGKAAKVVVSEKQLAVLNELIAARATPAGLVQRSRIIVLASQKMLNEDIEKVVGLHHDAVGLWRRRYRDGRELLTAAEEHGGTATLRAAIVKLLSDAPRSGRPPRITAEQQAALAAKACEEPADSDRPISHWSSEELADEMAKDSGDRSGFEISGRSVRRMLAAMVIRPHHHRYWLFSGDKQKDPMFDAKVQRVCEVYRDAIELFERDGVHTISIDEMTGIQALERTAADLPVRPGSAAKLEYEYRRHGTTTLFGNFHVATGKLWCPLLRKTRDEWDMLENINDIVCTGGEDAGYRLVMDNLNTHCSASMVQMIAGLIGYEGELGKKGGRGILKDVASRKAFLSDPTHRICCVYTPRHCSWLNQIEIWFSTLRRKVLRRGSFASVDALCDRIESFIEYYNDFLAAPFQWTYRGKVLAGC